MEPGAKDAAALADSALSVKLLMLVAVGLSALVNYGHGALLGHPLVGRELFGAPSVLSGWLFDLLLRYLRGARIHELRRSVQPLPQFGLVVWAIPPVGGAQALEPDRGVTVAVGAGDGHRLEGHIQIDV